MTDTNGSSSAGKRLAVLAVVERPDREDEGKRHTRWVKVGFAHVNRDGSMNLYLDAFPIGTNKLQVREEDRPQGASPRRNGFDTVEVRP
jgi:hypothetical protein